MNILIAGCGDLGQATALAMIAAGHAVWGLRRSPGKLLPNVLPVAADLGDAASLRQAVQPLPPMDVLLYAATPTTRDDAGYRATFVDGLSRVLDACPPTKLAMFVASTGVYGQNAGEIIDETAKTEPMHFTGQRLLEGESVLREQAAARGFVGVSLRVAGIYGPGRTRLIERTAPGEPLELPTPERWTNRIHRDDAAIAISMLVDCPLEQLSPAYNLVDNTPSLMSETLRFLRSEQAAANAVPSGPSPVPPPPSTSAIAQAEGKRVSNARLLAALQPRGWRPMYPSYREGYRRVMSGEDVRYA